MSAKAATQALVLSVSVVALAACGERDDAIGESRTESPTGGTTPNEGATADTMPRPESRDQLPAPSPAPQTATPYLLAEHPLDKDVCGDVPRTLELGVTGGRVYWQVHCVFPRSGLFANVLASAPVSGGPPIAVAAQNDLFAVSVREHVVVRRFGSRDGAPGWLSVVASGGTTETALPDSSQCLAATSDAQHVYCLSVGSADVGYERQLRRWSVVGGPPDTLGTYPSDAVDLVADAGGIFVVRYGTTGPTSAKGVRPEHHLDGRIERVDVTTGAVTLVREGFAPNRVTAVNNVLAWDDQYRSSTTVAGVDRSFFVLPPYGLPIEATASVYRGASWDFRATALDADASGIVLWAAATEAMPDVSLASNVRVRYVADVAEPEQLAVDATHVYWATTDGVFRRPK